MKDCFDVLIHTEEYVRKMIRRCQKDNHVQQVAYSTYHDALTQVCFDCKRVVTNIKDNHD